jgi:hypothetical protein
MEDYNKIIESLGVRFIKAKNIKVVKPVSIENFYDVENTIILVTAGAVGFGKSGRESYATEGEVLFVPGGKSVTISYGAAANLSLTNDEFISRKELYVQTHSDGSVAVKDSYSYVTFEAKVFNSVNFFASLDIEPFIIRNDDINYIIRQILSEVLPVGVGPARAGVPDQVIKHRKVPVAAPLIVLRRQPDREATHVRIAERVVFEHLGFVLYDDERACFNHGFSCVCQLSGGRD